MRAIKTKGETDGKSMISADRDYDYKSHTAFCTSMQESALLASHQINQSEALRAMHNANDHLGVPPSIFAHQERRASAFTKHPDNGT